METATQTLHRLTSYEPGRDWDEPIDDPRVLQDLVINDLDRLPWFYKRYEQSLPRVRLPRDLPTTTASAIAVLAGTAHAPGVALDLPQLSRLLHLSAGVTRTAERPYATWLFRAAGSAGGPASTRTGERGSVRSRPLCELPNPSSAANRAGPRASSAARRAVGRRAKAMARSEVTSPARSSTAPASPSARQVTLAQ